MCRKSQIAEVYLNVQAEGSDCAHFSSFRSEWILRLMERGDNGGTLYLWKEAAGGGAVEGSYQK